MALLDLNKLITQLSATSAKVDKILDKTDSTLNKTNNLLSEASGIVKTTKKIGNLLWIILVVVLAGMVLIFSVYIVDKIRNLKATNGPKKMSKIYS